MNSWINPCSVIDFICTESQRVQTYPFYFSVSTCRTNYSYWMWNIFFAQWCYTVLIWTLISVTFGWLNRPKPVHYIPTDKINASVQRMRILTSFVTSLTFVLLPLWLIDALSYIYIVCEYCQDLWLYVVLCNCKIVNMKINLWKSSEFVTTCKSYGLLKAQWRRQRSKETRSFWGQKNPSARSPGCTFSSKKVDDLF